MDSGRHPQKLPRHPALTTVTGDAYDAKTLAEQLKGPTR